MQPPRARPSPPSITLPAVRVDSRGWGTPPPPQSDKALLVVDDVVRLVRRALAAAKGKLQVLAPDTDGWGAWGEPISCGRGRKMATGLAAAVGGRQRCSLSFGTLVLLKSRMASSGRGGVMGPLPPQPRRRGWSVPATVTAAAVATTADISITASKGSTDVDVPVRRHLEVARGCDRRALGRGWAGLPRLPPPSLQRLAPAAWATRGNVGGRRHPPAWGLEPVWEE